MDNVPCHPESLKGKFSNINAVFLPKNTTSKTPPHDAGIIASWKVLYRKRLIDPSDQNWRGSSSRITGRCCRSSFRPRWRLRSRAGWFWQRSRAAGYQVTERGNEASGAVATLCTISWSPGALIIPCQIKWSDLRVEAPGSKATNSLKRFFLSNTLLQLQGLSFSWFPWLFISISINLTWFWLRPCTTGYQSFWFLCF